MIYTDTKSDSIKGTKLNNLYLGGSNAVGAALITVTSHSCCYSPDMNIFIPNEGITNHLPEVNS